MRAGLRLVATSALLGLGISGCGGGSGGSPAPPPKLNVAPLPLVNPFIGTGSSTDESNGNTFPGADVPYGMVQWSPDTTSRPNGGGYDYGDSRITGFSLTHVSGVGCGTAGDLPILPVVGKLGAAPGSADASFSHKSEKASPGFYGVSLGNGTSVALTATMHAGVGSFTFPATSSASLLLKLDDPDNTYVTSRLDVAGPNELAGSVTSSGFCNATQNVTLYFVIEFDRNFSTSGHYAGGGYATFDTRTDRTIVARVGVSYTSIDEARANLSTEVARQSFAKVQAAAQAQWTAALRKIQIGGGTAAQRTEFYTALYHAEQFPSVLSDADGSYLGYDGKVHKVGPGHAAEYTNFSAWDIYRSQAQLIALINPAAASDMAQSLLDDYAQGGTLPKWAMPDGDTYTMVGDSSVAVLADYFAFGGTHFDTAAALSAMETEQTTETSVSPGVTYLDKFGYLPVNSVYGCCHEYSTVSTQLEYDIDDFALSAFAGALGHGADQKKFQNRAQDWRNIFNPASGYLQPRGSNGQWQDGFVPSPMPSAATNEFAEDDSLIYTADIPFNLADLVRLKGGNAGYGRYLDKVLKGYQGQDSMTGMQADLGNEPSIELPWEYDWIGQPYKTQRHVRAIENQLWSTDPGGIPNNDDLGEMSAWFVWSTLGLYPEIPGTADLAIGSPLFTEAVISIGSTGKAITIVAPAAATSAPYVQHMTVDGADSSRAYLPAAKVLRGTTLNFSLGTVPNTSWGADPADAPPSYGGTPGTGVAAPVGAIAELAGKCLDDQGSSMADGTAIQTYPCDGTQAQNWRLAPDHTVQVLGNCMDVAGGATTYGASVQLAACNGTASQQWQPSASGELANAARGFCLTDPSKGATAKTQLVIATCTGAVGQIWLLPGK